MARKPVRVGRGREEDFFAGLMGTCASRNRGTCHCLSSALLEPALTQRRGHGEGIGMERRAASFPAEGGEGLENDRCLQKPGFSDPLLKEARFLKTMQDFICL